MRAIATRLDTGQSSLYAHVGNKFELDRLIAARLLTSLQVPDPDPATWREQLVEVYVQQAELFARHPGIESAYFASFPVTTESLAVIERILALYEVGGFTGEAMRDLELTLEAITVSWAIQSTVIRRRLEMLDVDYEQFVADGAESLSLASPERFPRATSYDIDTDLEARARGFEARLHKVIRGFEAQRGTGS